MANILQKLALATAGAILSFAALEANPTQAARFSFSFDDSSGRNLGGGLVDFDEEKLGLTGVGQEQVTGSGECDRFISRRFEFTAEEKIAVSQKTELNLAFLNKKRRDRSRLPLVIS